MVHMVAVWIAPNYLALRARTNRRSISPLAFWIGTVHFHDHRVVNDVRKRGINGFQISPMAIGT
jgi:hypothetical protein